MVAHLLPFSPGFPACLRHGGLLLMLGLAAGCGGGGGAGEGEGVHDPRLAALSVSAGTLVPAFSPDVHTYSLDVGGLAAGIEVTPTAMQVGTTIQVQGEDVPSADTSGPVPVDQGSVVPILVTTVAGDGAISSSYTILVLRAQLDSATLQGYLKKHAHVTDALGARYDAAHYFGYSVALSGDTLVVGAPLESGSGAGVNPPVGGVSAQSGAAYVFVRSGGTWTQQAYLKAPQPGEGDEFGLSVAVSGDRIVVGAPYEDGSQSGPRNAFTPFDEAMTDAGAAYVYVRSGGIWTADQVLKGIPDVTDQFGWSVAVSGETFVVGVPGDDSDATTVDGDPANVNAPDAGAAYVYVRNGGLWAWDYLKAPNTDEGDLLGRAVAVSGNTIVVGAPGESSAAGFANRDPSDDTLPFAGAAYVFKRSSVGSPWSFDTYLKSPVPDPFDFFGSAVAVSGRHIVVGAFGEDGGSGGSAADPSNNSALDAGAAFVFSRTGVVWGSPQILKADQPTAGDHFGVSVSVSGLIVAVGASDEDGSGTGVAPAVDELRPGSGAAYLFVIGPPWLAPLYVKAHVPDGSDDFGGAVAVSGDTFVAGAKNEASIALGVNGNAADNTGPVLGAAYVYR